ncbi:MAG: hypothetical protein JEY94_10775 [Melioribacteraceae bacterium]|nr:hypothetical protein [Melioribacteraceae bacterium]
MDNIDTANLVAFQEEPRITNWWRFQTTCSKLKRQMEGRNSFELTAYSTNEKFWIFRVQLPSRQAVQSRFKSLSNKEPVLDENEELYY